MSETKKVQDNKKKDTNKKEEKLSFKDKMLRLKSKAIDIKNDLVDKSADYLANSSLVIKDKKQLDEIIASTIPKEFTNNQTWEKKQFKRYALIIFVKKDTNFYKESLIDIPVLATKAWTQNVNMKITDLEYKWVETFPSLVVFENKKAIKILAWEENIKKIVKTMDFDIIKQIENISNQ